MNVLVTNGNSRMALSISRELKTLGHNVTVGDYVRNSMCFFSNKINDRLIYKSPYSDPMGFIETLKSKIKDMRLDCIIPIHEETFLLSKLKNELADIVSLPIPDFKAILKVHNKAELNKLLIEANVKTPKTYRLDQIYDRKCIKEILNGQVVIKPNQGGGNWGIVRLRQDQCYEEQINNYIKMTKLTPSRILLQEWLPIREKFSHVVVYQNGKFVQDFADRHLRDFPLTGGAGVLRQTCDASKMTSFSRKLFDSLNWHGVAEVEYVTHCETGEYYLIEVNPRIWGGVNSAIASGFNVPGMLLDIAQGLEPRVSKYKIGMITRWFWGDIRVFADYWNNSKNKREILKEYIKLLWDESKTDEFYWDDPLPFFVWPAHAIYKMLKFKSIKPVTYDSLAEEWK